MTNDRVSDWRTGRDLKVSYVENGPDHAVRVEEWLRREIVAVVAGVAMSDKPGGEGTLVLVGEWP
jgi:hypothetical protein